MTDDLTLDLATVTLAETIALEEEAGVALADLAGLERPPQRVLAAFAWLAARRLDAGLSFDAFTAGQSLLDLRFELVDTRAAVPFGERSPTS